MTTIPTLNLYRDDLECLVEPGTETFHHFLANGWSLQPKVLSVSAEPLPLQSPEPEPAPVVVAAPAKPRAPRKTKTAE